MFPGRVLGNVVRFGVSLEDALDRIVHGTRNNAVVVRIHLARISLPDIGLDLNHSIFVNVPNEVKVDARWLNPSLARLVGGARLVD
jgi:hypothetical protein